MAERRADGEPTGQWGVVAGDPRFATPASLTLIVAFGVASLARIALATTR